MNARAKALIRAMEFIDEVVVDTGGIGKVAAEELRAHGFTVRAKLKARAPSVCAAQRPRIEWAACDTDRGRSG